MQVLGWQDLPKPTRITLRDAATRLDSILPAALAATLDQDHGFLIPKDTLSFQFEVQDSEGNYQAPDFLMIHGGDIVDHLVRDFLATILGGGYLGQNGAMIWMDGCDGTGKCLSGFRTMVKGRVSRDSVRLTFEVLDAQENSRCLVEPITSVQRHPQFTVSSAWRSGDALTIVVGKDRLSLWNGEPLALASKAAKSRRSGQAGLIGLEGSVIPSSEVYHSFTGHRINMHSVPGRSTAASRSEINLSAWNLCIP